MNHLSKEEYRQLIQSRYRRALLKAAIPLCLPYYSQDYEILTPEIEQKLLTISTASIDRALKLLRDSLELKKRRQTRPGRLLKKKIPYKLVNPLGSRSPKLC